MPLFLSKSRYLAGLQCPKRLWLGAHRPGLATPAGPGTEALLEAGAEIGKLARALFPGGVPVESGPGDHEAAVARTRGLRADPTVPALFEAAFEHRGVGIRADVLQRLDGGRWGLREVKSSGSVKKVHLEDLALQRFVLDGCGLDVASTQLVHVDKGYVRGGGETEWDRLFARREVTEEVEARLDGLAGRVEAMRGLLGRAEPPGVEPGPHCRSPVRCEFWEHCAGGKPADWVLHLPGLRSGRFEELRGRGIERIPDVPEGFPLTPHQARAREACRRGGPVVEGGLAGVLEDLGPPACYLDFETAAPALPLYPGTRPYEHVPFQWSLLRCDGGPAPAHSEFLAEGPEDPRRAFAETLLGALEGSRDPVLVYSSYEARTLKNLALLFPDLADRLEALRGRLRDLHRVVRAHVYHPGFGGSFSVKAVAPALAPGFGYGDLRGVAGGDQASLAFPRLADGRTDPRERERTREALRAYCRRDTEAMLELHRALRRLAAGERR